MKKITFLSLTIGLSVLTACSVFKGNSAKEEKRETGKVITTPSGLSYVLNELGAGESVDSGNVVTVHYTGFLTDSTKFDSSKDRNEPFTFKVGGGMVIGGWDEGLSYLKVGDKATFTIPAELGYGSKAQGSIPANSTLIFDVDVLNVKDGAKPFIVKGLDTTSFSSGLKMIKMIENTDSILPNRGQMVSVDYSGYLIDGKLFDSSVDRGKPIEFPVGNGSVIKGWDEAILKMHKGDKARLIIPASLAYGERGAGKVIPPNATLIFDVVLVDIK